jgi:hypothetical protein
MINPNYARQIQEKVIIKLSQLPIVQQQQILELVESFAPPPEMRETKQIAWARTLQRLRQGYHLGGKMPLRESLYER